MKALSDGLSVLAGNWQGVIGVLVFVCAGSILIGSTLRSILGNRLTTAEYFPLGLAGWIFPVSLLSWLWIILGEFQPLLLGLLFGFIAVTIFTRFLLRFKTDLRLDSISTTLILSLFIFLSILLRLAFISKAILPSYFDSAQHDLFIQDILNTRTEFLTLTRYYHLGFHVLTAFMTSTLHLNVAKAMLVLGQVILAIMPVAVFPLIKQETGSSAAGIFAAILAGFGWYMPAHAVDWGKYPALMSLGMIPFVLSLAYLIMKHQDSLTDRKRRTLYGISGLGILLATFTHSRALIVFGVLALAWLTAAWRQKRPRMQQAWVLVAVIASLIFEFILIQRQEVLRLLFDPYINNGIWITAFVLFLSIFAFKAYPRLTFICILSMSLLIAALFIPVKGLIPGYDNLTLLDRPYAEMILYLPLSLLGGLGLAGMEQTKIKRVSWNQYASLIVLAAASIYSLARYDFYPSDCCVIVGNDDVVAMDWMNARLPADARLGIASTELKVMATESAEGSAGSDAGVWITPLIHRSASILPYDSDFDQRSVLDLLCQGRIGYLYVGELGQAFDDAKLSSNPDWYLPVLSMPKVKVYQVIGCK